MDHDSKSSTSKPVARIFYGIENLVQILKTTKLSDPNWLTPVDDLFSDVALEPVLFSTEKYTAASSHSMGSEPFVARRNRVADAYVRKKTYCNTNDELRTCTHIPDSNAVFDASPSDYMYDGRVPIPHCDSEKFEDSAKIEKVNNFSDTLSANADVGLEGAAHFDEFLNPLYAELGAPDPLSFSASSFPDSYRGSVSLNSTDPKVNSGDKIETSASHFDENCALNTKSNLSSSTASVNSQPTELPKSVKIIDIGKQNEREKNVEKSVHTNIDRVQISQKMQPISAKKSKAEHVGEPAKLNVNRSIQDDRHHMAPTKSTGMSKKKALFKDSNSSVSTLKKSSGKNTQYNAENSSLHISKTTISSPTKEFVKPSAKLSDRCETKIEKKSKNIQTESKNNSARDEENREFWEAAVKTSNKSGYK